jgi:hypothetical protein
MLDVFSLFKIYNIMRKVLMMVVAVLFFVGTAVTAKAASLLSVSGVSVSQDDENGLVLKHANELFGNSDMSFTSHGSHGSHGSHSSHASHASHSSHQSSY